MWCVTEVMMNMEDIFLEWLIVMFYFVFVLNIENG